MITIHIALNDVPEKRGEAIEAAMAALRAAGLNPYRGWSEEIGSYAPGTEVERRRVCDEDYTGTCGRCGSLRWVSVSFNGGLTRVPQCVPCGFLHPYVVLENKPIRAEASR